MGKREREMELEKRWKIRKAERKERKKYMQKSDEDKKRKMKKIQNDINVESIWEKKRDTWKKRVNETVGNLRMEKQKK